MLYGHTHASLSPEDNGELLSYDKEIYSKGFTDVLKKHGLAANQNIIQDLLKVAASTKGINLTLDVGVDNCRKGLPFGTPWSMDDVHAYMNKKKPKWIERNFHSNLKDQV